MDAREKVLEPLVQRAIANVRQEASAKQPAIREAFSYGAIGINPKHLVIWYIFESESDKAEAKVTGLTGFLEARSREALRRESYPAQAIGQIQVDFASDEGIRRAGGFRAFFA